MRTGLSRLIVGACVATIALSAIMMGATARHLPVSDPDDTRGRLDVRRVTHSGGSRPRWDVITYEGWTKKQVFDVGYVTLMLDTKARARPDYYVLVGSFGTHLYGHLWRDRLNKPDYKIANVNVWKPTWRKIAIRLPLAKMKIGPRRIVYRWSVETLFTGARCRRVCFDVVPDSGAVAEPIPGRVAPSPTPTVSPSPGPTESPSPDPSATPTPSPTSS